MDFFSENITVCAFLDMFLKTIVDSTIFIQTAVIWIICVNYNYC